MWISGVTAGLMWRAMNDDGTLTYTFVESVKAMHPFYAIRMIGGLMYASGMILMLWNTIKTVQMGQAARARIPSALTYA